MQVQILTFVIPIMTLIFAGIFFAFWWQQRSRLYILTYAYWFASVAVGISLQAFIIKNFGPPEVLLFHLISSTGLIALLWGISARDAEKTPLWGFAAVTGGTGAVVWFARAYDVQTVVLMAQNFNAGLLFAMGAYRLWLSNRTHLADRALLFTFMLLAAYSIFRPSITITLASAMTMEEYQNSIMFTVNMAMTMVLSLLLCLALISTILVDTMGHAREKARLDPLTGLPNRAAFEAQAAAMLERARDERIPVSLLVGDIDHFKRVNDTWGHSAGDRVITTFGRLLANKIRPGDVAGRVGGEEFCVLVWNCPEHDAASLGDRLRAGFAQMDIDGFPPGETFTASFGVAQWERGEGYSDTFRKADAALYAAKRAGRNQVASAKGAGKERCASETGRMAEDRDNSCVVPLRRRNVWG